MIWLDLLRRFWKPLAAAVLIICAGAYLHHRWYSAGAAARDAYWQPQFDAAQRALTAANAKARQQEADSKALSAQSEKQHAEKIASLDSRIADAERRYASLLRKHPAGSSCVTVPSDGGAAGDADAARASSELIDRTGRDFASLARRCEADAAALTDLQEWVRGQLTIQRARP